MKIAITGHTRGIGKGLADELSSQGHSIVGFSRTNGYDTKLETSRKSIIENVTDCDIFINNAFPGQHEMFNLIFDAWRNDKTKTIINIGSISKYKEFTLATEYIITKWKLYKLTLHPILHKQKLCRLMLFNPGLVDTDMVKKDTRKNKMTVEECVKLMSWAILQPQHIEIAELSFWLTDDGTK